MRTGRFWQFSVRPQLVGIVLAVAFLVNGLANVMPLANAARVSESEDTALAYLPHVLGSLSKLQPIIQYKDCRELACVALTFDDGPAAATTPQVLHILAKTQVPATFFVVGSRAAQYPQIVRAEAQAGHEVENHSWSHPDLRKLTDDQIKSQVQDTQNVITSLGAPAPKYFRPPYGWRDDRIRNAVGKPMVIWNVDPQEWRPGDKPEALVDAVVSHTQRGSIVLMHDIKPITVTALEPIIIKLKEAGYHLVTVDNLLQLPPDARGEYSSQP